MLLRTIRQVEGDNSPIAARNSAIITLMVTCGLRRDEISATRWSDIARQGRNDVLRVHGKGEKLRIVKLPDMALLAIDVWRKYHPIPDGDRAIFTRIGASDDLARGQSTFLVEMNETANILHHATPHSLVILDEIGRGTSTFDGLSIAWSVAEYLHDEVRALALFATHYHELTQIVKDCPAAQNCTVAVREWNDEIVFLHRIIPGAADRSRCGC